MNILTANGIIYTEYISVLGFICYHMVVFVFLMMFQYFFRDILQKAADQAIHQSLKSILFGLAFLIVVPVISLLLMITLLGIPLGLLLLFVYVIIILLATFLTSVSVANWITLLGKDSWGFWPLCILSLAIFLVITLLLRIPVLGWVILGILSCSAIGSVLVNVNWTRISEFMRKSLQWK